MNLKADNTKIHPISDESLSLFQEIVSAQKWWREFLNTTSGMTQTQNLDFFQSIRDLSLNEEVDIQTFPVEDAQFPDMRKAAETFAAEWQKISFFSHYILAKLRVEEERYKEARKILNHWIKDNNDPDRETYFQRLLEDGEYEQACAITEDWLKIDSRDKEARQVLRETYLRPAKQLLEGGEYEQARALLEDWLKIDSRDKEARQVLRETYLRPAKQLLEGGEYEQARALLEDWLKIDSKDEEAGQLRRTSYLSLAKDKMKARNFEVAWQVIQSWLEQNHYDTQARIFFLNQVIENNFYESMRPLLKVWFSEARNISSLENVFLFPARELLKRSLYRPSRDERINYWYKFALDALEVGRSSSAATEMEYQLFSFLLNSALKDKDTLPELFNQSEASALYLHAGRGVQKYLSQKSEAKSLLRRASLEPAIAILMQEDISNKQYLHIRNLLDDWLKIARDDEEARQVLRETYLRPAKQLLEGGEYEQARTVMEDWLKIARDDEEARQVLRETYLRPAKQLLEGGEYEQARTVMEDWLKIARDDEEARQVLRETYLRPAKQLLEGGEYEQARTVMEDWLKIARDDEEARQVLRETYLRPAKQLLEGGEYEKSRALMENWLKIDSRDKEARQVLRETYLRPAKQLLEGGEYEQARTVMEDWLKIARDDEEARQVLRETYLRPAKQLLESGEYEKSRALMENWLKIDSRDEEARQVRYLSLPKLELIPSALDFGTMEQGLKDSDTIEVKHPFGNSVDYDTETRNIKGRGANWLQIHSSDSGYRHEIKANRPGYLTIDIDIPVSEISLGIHVMHVKIIPDDRDMQASYLEVSVNIIFPRTRWLLETIGWGLGVGLPFLISYFLYVQGDEENASQILGKALAVYGLIFFFIWLFLTPHDDWD